MRTATVRATNLKLRVARIRRLATITQTATDDDGSCDYCSCAGEETGGGESSGYTLTVEEYANDIIPGQVTYRWYVDMANGDDFLSSVYGNDGDPLEMSTENGFYNDPLGASVATGINPAFIAVLPNDWRR